MFTFEFIWKGFLLLFLLTLFCYLICKGTFTLRLFSARLVTVKKKVMTQSIRPIGNRNFPVTLMSRARKSQNVNVPQRDGKNAYAAVSE